MVPQKKKTLTEHDMVEIAASTKAKDGKTADERIVERGIGKIVDERCRPTPGAMRELFRHMDTAPVEPPLLVKHRASRPRNK